jgi:hypothetical protein
LEVNHFIDISRVLCFAFKIQNGSYEKLELQFQVKPSSCAAG